MRHMQQRQWDPQETVYCAALLESYLLANVIPSGAVSPEAHPLPKLIACRRMH